MKVNILGIQVDCVGMAQTLAQIEQFIQERKPRLVITPNVDHLIKARQDKEFNKIYAESDLNVPDGVPLLWAARFLGRPLLERVNGTDLFEALCARAAERGHRVFLLGGPPGAAEQAAKILQERNPGLQVVGAYAPPMGFVSDDDENRRIAARLRKTRPDILFVGLGAPKQEKWIHRHMHKLGVPVSIGVGASFEYVAGTSPRAPRWMQRTGLEWLHRVLSDPARYWKRYIVEDFKFFPLVVAQRLQEIMSRSRDKQSRVPLPA